MYRLLFMSDLIALAQWARFTTVYWLIVVVSIDLISTSISIRHVAGRCNFCTTPLTNWDDFPTVCLTIHNAATLCTFALLLLLDTKSGDRYIIGINVPFYLIRCGFAFWDSCQNCSYFCCQTFKDSDSLFFGHYASLLLCSK